MANKKSPVFKDMVRVASCMRSENGDFLKDDSGQVIPSINDQFKKFSFLKEDTVRSVVTRYLNNIDRGI
jgi:hypothetical protein